MPDNKPIVTATARPAGRIITIEMSEEVAETVRLVCNKIGGRNDGKRGHMDAINNALAKAGVRDQYDPSSSSGSIYFTP